MSEFTHEMKFDYEGLKVDDTIFTIKKGEPLKVVKVIDICGAKVKIESSDMYYYLSIEKFNFLIKEIN
jgi:hypothetical protein